MTQNIIIFLIVFVLLLYLCFNKNNKTNDKFSDLDNI